MLLNASASSYKELLMQIGIYLVQTPGSSLDEKVLIEIESILNILTYTKLPKGIHSNTIDDLYDKVSVLTIMRKEGKLDNLPKKAKQAGRAFQNAADLLSIIVPIVIFNSDLF